MSAWSQGLCRPVCQWPALSSLLMTRDRRAELGQEVSELVSGEYRAKDRSLLLSAAVTDLRKEGKTRKRKPHWCGKSSSVSPGGGGYTHTSAPCFSTAWLSLVMTEFSLQQASSSLFCRSKFPFIRRLLLVLFICFFDSPK